MCNVLGIVYNVLSIVYNVLSIVYNVLSIVYHVLSYSLYCIVYNVLGIVWADIVAKLYSTLRTKDNLIQVKRVYKKDLPNWFHCNGIIGD